MQDVSNSGEQEKGQSEWRYGNGISISLQA